jgi:DUF4097 and DUF4098 domain-containing protein YvlB
MKRMVSGLLLLAGILLLVPGPVGAQQSESWDFTAATRIEFDGTSGDVSIVAAEGTTGRVELYARVTPADAFQGEVVVRDGVVSIDEHWSGRRSSGQVKWTIHLPKSARPVRFSGSTASGDLDIRSVDVEVRFRTASGDLTMSGASVTGSSKVSTASGDIDLTDLQVATGTSFSTASGDVELTRVKAGEDVEFTTASGDVVLDGVEAGRGARISTASGDVRARGCTGLSRLSSASGDVDIRDCELSGEGRFSSASGDVQVTFARLPAFDLRVSSASGNAELEVGEWRENFRLVLIKRKDRGRMSCPFPYTEEREFEENDRIYVERTVIRGTGGPEITVRSASGDVIVRR